MMKRLITTSLKIKNVLEDANTEFSTDASNRIQNGPTEDKYKIVRFFRDDEVMNGTVVKTGLSLKEAQAHCKDPETSSGTATSVEAKMRTDKYGPWFEGYTKE
jgi:hypothetical protein